MPAFLGTDDEDDEILSDEEIRLRCLELAVELLKTSHGDASVGKVLGYARGFLAFVLEDDTPPSVPGSASR